MEKGGAMKNNLIRLFKYYKKHRLDFLLIFIAVFFLYYFLTKHYNAALGWLTLGIAINIVDLAHKHFKAKENKGSNKQNQPR